MTNATMEMSRAKDTSVVEPEKLPDVSAVQYENLPADMDAAVERIRALEMALEDMSRAAEIAQYSGQFEIVGSFIETSFALLETKIKPVEKEAQDMKITIIG